MKWKKRKNIESVRANKERRNRGPEGIVTKKSEGGNRQGVNQEWRTQGNEEQAGEGGEKGA